MTLRCLLVDDSPRFLGAAHDHLEREGIVVVGVATTIACSPARAWLRVIWDQPLRALAPASFQPGSSRTHGTSEADGTDWAWSHSGSGRSQSSCTI